MDFLELVTQVLSAADAHPGLCAYAGAATAGLVGLTKLRKVVAALVVVVAQLVAYLGELAAAVPFKAPPALPAELNSASSAPPSSTTAPPESSRA